MSMTARMLRYVQVRQIASIRTLLISTANLTTGNRRCVVLSILTYPSLMPTLWQIRNHWSGEARLGGRDEVAE